jgi:hypothetical protein
MDYYERYFDMQVGGGKSGGGSIGRVYIESPYHHGGIGSFLAGLFP